ncbi:OmpP1/FadL family transporter [Aquimarina agarilytica]|uniref:OmpP1/FadL family transporter n=1 Tax=Aquimarina agarilytica TaxID=1087449 RepID=UPI000287AC5D|nr:outer membrane protein transport protein [Aquimarina agarilytica]
MKKLLFSIALGLITLSAFAGGYRVSLQGQRALAMGHTGVGVVDSAELAFFNPAGLVYLENKLNISGGVTLISSTAKYQNTLTGESAKTDNPLSTPFNLYISYGINDWLSVALAAYTPYGSSIEWEKDWAGSDLVNSISLKSIYINPVISIKLDESFSIGGGPIYATGSVNFDRNLVRTPGGTPNNPNVEVDADGVDNWGWVFSTMFRPSENVAIGASYRSKIELNARGGDVTFTNIDLPETQFNATLPLPAELTFGGSVKVSPKLLLAAEFNRTYWSTYKSLDIDFTNPASTDSRNARNYKNSNIYRIGAQYDLNDKLTLRGGYYYDESPVQSGFYSPETPRNDSQGFTTGFSYNVTSKLAIDASFLYLYFSETDESYDSNPNDTVERFSGTYKSNAIIGGLGLTYKL